MLARVLQSPGGVTQKKYARRIRHYEGREVRHGSLLRALGPGHMDTTFSFLLHSAHRPYNPYMLLAHNIVYSAQYAAESIGHHFINCRLASRATAALTARLAAAPIAESQLALQATVRVDPHATQPIRKARGLAATVDLWATTAGVSEEHFRLARPAARWLATELAAHRWYALKDAALAGRLPALVRNCRWSAAAPPYVPASCDAGAATILYLVYSELLVASTVWPRLLPLDTLARVFGAHHPDVLEALRAFAG